MGEVALGKRISGVAISRVLLEVICAVASFSVLSSSLMTQVLHR